MQVLISGRKGIIADLSLHHEKFMQQIQLACKVIFSKLEKKNSGGGGGLMVWNLLECTQCSHYKIYYPSSYPSFSFRYQSFITGENKIFFFFILYCSHAIQNTTAKKVRRKEMFHKYTIFSR